MQNFIRFCEAILKQPTVKKIKLITSYDDHTNVQEMAERLQDVKQGFLELDVELDIKVNENLHDREIRIDNGWIVKIGRGLDFFQKPDSWFSVGVNDLALRKCLETKVDIYRLHQRNLTRARVVASATFRVRVKFPVHAFVYAQHGHELMR